MRSVDKSSRVLTVTLSPAFKVVFFSVLAVTLICLVLSCILVGITVRAGGGDHMLTSQESALFDLFTSTFKLGFGAILGLLGGKAL